MERKTLWNILKGILGIILLGILIRFLGTNEVLSNLINTEWYVAPLLIFSILFIAFLNAVNFHLFAKSIGSKIKFKKTLYHSMVSWSVARVSPGNLGDFSLIPLLKKEGIEYGESSVIVILDKIINLVVLMLLSIYPLVVLMGLDYTIKSFLILSLIVIIFLGILINKTTRNIIRDKILPKKISRKIKGFSRSLTTLIFKSPEIIFINFSLTLLKMASAAYIFMIVFKSYNLEVPFLTVISIKALGSLAAYLPISPAGLGIKEGIIALAYSYFTIDPIVPTTTYLLSRFFLILIAVIIGILVLKKKKI